MTFLHDLRVLVLGLGDSGLAMARWCARHGARVHVWDSREAPPQAAALRQAVPGAVLACGPIDVDAVLREVRLILKSPGLAPGDARIAPLLAAARGIGLAVQGELDLFAQALADLKATRGYAPKVLAITGTNGKTTTTSLTGLLVERAGLRVAVAGNIGPTMLDTLQAALDLEPAAGAATPSPDEPPMPGRSDDEAAADAQARAALEVDEVADLAALDGVTPDEAASRADADTDADGSADPDTDPDADADAATPVIVPPPAAPVFEHLPEVWVLELSSFQLDGVRGFEPSAAAVLNVTQDHLDWHGTMQAYAAAKARIHGERAVMVVNRDDPTVEAMVPPPLVVKGGRGQRSRTVQRDVIRFGLDAPRAPGDFGLVTENGMAWLVRALPADETDAKRGRKAAAADEDLHLQRLMPADALRIRGRHNAANALAALALATSIGCPLAPMLHGLREYRGEPHRVQHVGRLGEVDAYDDSKGTNVGATVAALNGLGPDQSPGKLLVVLGGDGKGQDFAPLAEPLARHARAVALIGRDGPAIAEALGAGLAEAGVGVQAHGSLEAATRWCFEQARPGDAVLLSPACASLDMFRHYAHRAEVFVATVQALADERGDVL